MRVHAFTKPLMVENQLVVETSPLEMQLALRLYSPAKIVEFQHKAHKEQCGLVEIFALETSGAVFYTQLAQLVGAKYALHPPSLPLLITQNWKTIATSGMMPLENGQIWHAPEGKQLSLFLSQCEADPDFAKRFVLCPPFVFKRQARLLSRRLWTHEAIHAVYDKYPSLSANNLLQMRRGAGFILLGLGVLLGLFLQGGLLTTLMGGIFAFLFLGWLIFRVLASFLMPHAPLVSRPKVLPPYTLVLALYREAKVLPRLITALEALDYPRSKLDIKLILESDDGETREALKHIQTDLMIDVIIAPPEGPRTKPKALMLALPYARGKFCVVYDAEDRPHPQQLLESVARFQTASKNMAVMQAPLVIRNHQRNMLTKLFAAEYAALFDLTLPLLAHYDLPLPLGGTSNHFRTSILREVGGWDAFNVTEDADLGLRLARLGFSAGTLRLGTSEEAPTKAFAWLKQRSRWFKGWLQTLIVHGATPRNLLTRLGFIKSLVFFLMIGSTFFSSLLHPLAYVLLCCYTMHWLQGDVTLLLSLMGLGYGLAFVLLWQGARLGARAHPGKALWLLPVYWLMLSAAAWLALFELWRRPFHWAKTTHEGDEGD